MTRAEATAKLARALGRAAEEHGRPNSFGIAELFFEYGGPGCDWAGKLGLEGERPASPHFGKLYAALGGRERFGSAPRYHRERFFV